MVDKNVQDNSSILVKPVVEALLDINHVFPARYLSFFSDISEKGLQAVRKAWPKVAVERKISLLSDLETLMEADSLLCFDEMAKFALEDNDPHVRSRAISLLWESKESRFVEALAEMLNNDPSKLVQVSAAAGLGRFILLGELDEIPEKSFELALSTLRKKDLETPYKEIQQEILKSLAYTGSPEIERQIERAYADPDLTWQLAAIIAMGRTADERWELSILESMNSQIIAIQNEAVKAAGEIELESARLPLLGMVETGIADLELRLHVVWALARIGGEDVKTALHQLLEEADDDEEINVIEMALDHLDFSEELPDLDL